MATYRQENLHLRTYRGSRTLNWPHNMVDTIGYTLSGSDEVLIVEAVDGVHTMYSRISPSLRTAERIL